MWGVQSWWASLNQLLLMNRDCRGLRVAGDSGTKESQDQSAMSTRTVKGRK